MKLIFYFNFLIYGGKLEAQRDKTELSNETELLTGNRGKKKQRPSHILHSSVKTL